MSINPLDLNLLTITQSLRYFNLAFHSHSNGFNAYTIISMNNAFWQHFINQSSLQDPHNCQQWILWCYNRWVAAVSHRSSYSQTTPIPSDGFFRALGTFIQEITRLLIMVPYLLPHAWHCVFNNYLMFFIFTTIRIQTMYMHIKMSQRLPNS